MIFNIMKFSWKTANDENSVIASATVLMRNVNIHNSRTSRLYEIYKFVSLNYLLIHSKIIRLNFHLVQYYVQLIGWKSNFSAFPHETFRRWQQTTGIIAPSISSQAQMYSTYKNIPGTMKNRVLDQSSLNWSQFISVYSYSQRIGILTIWIIGMPVDLE